METVVKEVKTKSAARSLRNFTKRTGAEVIDPVNLLVDKAMRRLKEEDLLDPDVSESKVRNALMDFARKRRLSVHKIGVDEFLEEYEDMVLGRTMEERINEPSESMEDVMEFLRQR